MSDRNKIGVWQGLKAVAVLGGVVAAGSADGSVAFVDVDNSASAVGLQGFVTQDLTLTTEVDWSVSVMNLELSSGSIFQHQFGPTSGAPSQALIDFDADAEFDTYVQAKGGGSVSLFGGAGDLGSFETRFDEIGISQTWGNTAKADTGTFTNARITLSEDAAGTFSFGFAAGGTGQVNIVSGVVMDGVMIIQEALLLEPLVAEAVGEEGVDEINGKFVLVTSIPVSDGTGDPGFELAEDFFPTLFISGQQLDTLFAAAAAPEPASAGLVLAGLAALVGGRRRRA